MGGDLAATQPFCETTRPVSTVPEQGNGMPGDLIGFPSQDALECRVAALDGLIPAEQRDANGRGIENRLQFGGRPAEFRRSLGHLRFQFAAHLAKVLLRQCALECGSGVIRSDREEQQVDLGGKVTATAGRCHKTAFSIDADGNHHTPSRLGAAADVGNDLPSGQPADHGEVPSQPLRKLLPSVPPRQLDRGAARRVAQADISEIDAKGSDQDVSKPGCDVARLPPDPGHRQTGNRQQIPQRSRRWLPCPFSSPSSSCAPAAARGSRARTDQEERRTDSRASARP